MRSSRPDAGDPSTVLPVVVDQLDDVVFVADAQPGGGFRFSEMAGSAFEVVGAPGRHAVGATIEEVLPAGDAALARSWWNRALETGARLRYESEDDWPLGRRTFSISVVRVEPGRVAGTYRDVTAERRALRRAFERDELNRAILDALPEQAAVIDHEGRVMAVNRSWVRALAAGDVASAPGDDFLDEMGDEGDSVRDVLAGLAMEWQADRLEGARWFRVQVRAIPLDDRGAALVTRLDITREAGEAQALRESTAQWEMLFDGSAVGMAVIEYPGGKLVHGNRRLAEILGRPVDQLAGLTSADVSHADDPAPTTYTPADADAAPFEKRYLRPDGSVVWCIVRGTPFALRDGRQALFAQFEDITARRRLEARLDDHRRLLELVAAGAPLPEIADAICEIGERHLHGSRWAVWVATSTPGGRVVSAPNLPPAFLEFVDSHQEAIGQPWAHTGGTMIMADHPSAPGGSFRAGLAATGVRASIFAPVVTPDGLLRGGVVANDPPALDDPDDRSLVELLGSVARIAIERDENLRRLATRLLEDSLTGLPTRPLLHQRAEHAIAQVGHTSRGVAVLTVDLDSFGRVNANLGPRRSDEVLAEIGARLRELISPPHTVARGGGDEFVMLLEDVPDATTALDIAERLLAAVREPFDIGAEVPVRCTASVGVSFTDSADRDIDDLEKAAALAGAVAKTRGRDRAVLYNETILADSRASLDLERELEQAVEQQQFVVHYQPEVTLRDNRLFGFEALVRWQHPERGLLPPAEFISAAEASGAIVDIGRIVLDEGCRQLAEWVRLTGEPLTLSVNLAAAQLSDPGLVDHVRDVLTANGLQAEQLMFEITESTMVDDHERATMVFQELRSLGVQLAIDDFGTGYSSLLYLKKLPTDALKVDRSFVDGLGTDGGDSAIVSAVVKLAHRLNLQVVAEGVETPLQLAHLRRLGCDIAQGYLWAKPLPADEAGAMLAAGIHVPDDVPFDDLPGDHEGAELDDLLAMLTHELSTPLTVIGGYAEMLHSRLQDKDSSALTGVAAIERNVHNLARLVTALAEARGRSIGTGEMTDVDVVAFVEQLVADLAPILADHEIRLHLPPCRAMAELDQVGMRQVFTNLLNNATKFAEPGTPIEVTVGAGDAVTISVIDHGQGVPAARVDQLFNRFSRLGSTKRGLGLGLYLSRSIVRRHGGDIVHAATPGGGATFTVSLPTSC